MASVLPISAEQRERDPLPRLRNGLKSPWGRRHFWATLSASLGDEGIMGPSKRRGPVPATISLPDPGARSATGSGSSSVQGDGTVVRRYRYEKATIALLALTMVATAASPAVTLWLAGEDQGTSASFSTPPTLAKSGCSTTIQRQGSQIGGTADPIEGEQVWLLVQAPGAGLFYLPDYRSLRLSPDGEWSTSIPAVGSAEDVGQTFALVLVSGDLNVANTFTQLYNDPTRDPAAGASMRALPAGAAIVALGCVTRA